MGRSLLTLALLGVLIAAAIWAWQRWRDRFDALPGTADRRALTGVLAEERATLAHGRDRGPGVLRLTDSQLVFTADSGRVLAVERLDVVGVTQTRNLPDRDVTRPALVVTTPADTYFFAVRSAAQWEALLT